MYLIAPATIMFIGAEMHIDPALLSAISALVGALVGGAPRRPPPSAPTLQRHKAAVAKPSSLIQLLGEHSGSAWQHGLAAFDFVAMPEVSHALRHKTPQLQSAN